MSNGDAFVMGLLAGSVLGAGAMLSTAVPHTQVYDRAAQTECAWFNPDTGDFEWLDAAGDER